MIPLRIARLIVVASLAAAIWGAATPVLARTVDESFPIVVNAEGIPFLPETAIAGLTLVSLDNATDRAFGASLYFVPAAVVGQVLGGTPTPEETAEGSPGELPAWIAGATPVGGPGIAGSSGHTEAVIDLFPGDYALVFNAFDPESGTLVSYLLEHEDGTPFFIAVEKAGDGATPETGGPATPAAGVPDATPVGSPETEIAEVPDETVTVIMTDDAILLPSSFPIGPQTWEVINQGHLPHALIVVTVPAQTTPDHLRAVLFPPPAESAPAAAAVPFDPGTMINIGGLGPLAPGLHAAAALDLAPGTYAVFSALPDPVTGEPDGANGLLTTFLVG